MGRKRRTICFETCYADEELWVWQLNRIIRTDSSCFFLLRKGHPDYGHIGPLVEDFLTPKSQSEKQQVVVIGQGNVALDCARIMAKGRSHLVDTDITSKALDVLKDGVQSTVVLGRRGHVQGAFTIKVSIFTT